MVPGDRHQAAGRSSAPEVRLAMWIMAAVFGLFILVGTTAGLVFNTVTIALPKVIDERIGSGISLVAVGGIATVVFLCGAVAQFTVGRVLEKYPPHLVFAGGRRSCSSSAWSGWPMRPATCCWSRSPSPWRSSTRR